MLLFGLGIAVVGLGLALSIALHELGHLVPAKLFGVRVTQYMIGFGPTLLSRTRGETEYGLKAIPLGGYIRMIGMYPPHKGEPEGTIREDSTGLLQQITELSDEAKAYESAQYGPEDAHRTFVALSVPKKLVVMLGGPAMNLLISVVLMLVLVSGIGLPAITPTVQSVSECVVPADAPADVSCEGRPPAPALAAGIRPGDTLREIDGHRIQRWQDVTTAVREAGDRTVDVVVERDGEELELQATMVVDDRPVLDEDGAAVHDAAGDLVTEQVGFLGVAGTPDLEPQSRRRCRRWRGRPSPGRAGSCSPCRCGCGRWGRPPSAAPSAIPTARSAWSASPAWRGRWPPPSSRASSCGRRPARWSRCSPR